MGQVNQPSDINSEVRELKRQVQELTKRVGLSSAVISRGGLRIINEGELVMVDENDVVIFTIGQVTFGAGTSYGMRLNYDNGNRGIVFGGTPGSQVFALCDETGNYLVTNDAASGFGLARPYFSYPLIPTSDAMIEGTVLVPSTRSASYVPIYEGQPTVWHPRVSYYVSISATGVTDWRILVNGAAVFTGSASAAGAFSIPGWGSTILPGNAVTFTIEARNTGGGFTRIRVLRFEGQQS
jgi:hypothetical protein